jgi:nucleoid-associated protein YgaU
MGVGAAGAAGAAPTGFAGAGSGASAPGGAAQPPRRERRRDADAPEWERARPSEVYPTLRARRLPELSVPPLLVAVVALALAAAVLFALPGLLGFGSPSAQSSASPSPGASTAPASLAPTPVPQPTPQVYIVQSGDTMSKIAKKFGVALGDLIAANAESIPNPDRLKIGDQVTIPVPQASGLPAAS